MEKKGKIRKKELVDFIDEFLVDKMTEIQKVNKGTRQGVFHDLIENLIKYLKEGLNKSHSIEIRGFGSLRKLIRKGKKGRKVKTGELVIFDDYFDIKLKIAKSFKKMLNDKKKG